MSHLINKLLGREDEHESHTGTVIKTQAGSTGSSSTGVQRQNSSGGTVVEGRTVERDGVNIRSTVSSDAVSTVSMANQQKLSDLVSRLGTTHNQIDEYAKKQSQKINDEIQREINEVVNRTQREQGELLRKANERTGQIDQEYRTRIQQMVEEIDAAKAKRIAEVEQELNEHQTGILQAARNEIDQLNQKAAALKIGALQQAQAKVAADASNITAQATELKATTQAHGTGTTTIKTEVSAAQTTKETVSGSSGSAGGASGSAGGASGSSSSSGHQSSSASHQSSGSTSRN